MQNGLLLAQEGQQVLPPSLKISVVAGQKATNNINKRTAIEPVVLVSNEQGQPVSGVMVVFTLPESGASGVFSNGSRSAIVYTGPDGRAIAMGLKPNATRGDFQLQVDASFHGLTAHATIEQTNVLQTSSKGPSPKLIAILAIAGGAAVAGALAAGGGGGSSPSPSVPPPSPSGATSIVVGMPTFGPPR